MVLVGLFHHLGVYCLQVFIQTEPALNAIAFNFYFFLNTRLDC